MSHNQESVLQYIEENDVKFVRLVFTDIFGVPKNVAVMAEQLPRVFAHGAGFDVSALDGFMNVDDSDLLLFPDPASLAVLPWRPSTGRVVRMYCDIKRPDGSAFVGDGRALLRQAVREAAMEGFTFRVGTECEFYLFELDEQGNPTTTPHDRAGYLDIGPLDRGENVRRDICLALEQMGLYPQGSHHEKGPGQNEIWCSATDPLRAADDFITYKSVVRTIAAQNGLHACFMPKPLDGKSGNGLHINITPRVEGQDKLASFMAGVLAAAADMTLFFNTTTNSYRRFGSFDAPKFISWSRGNRAQLLRMPAADSDRAELRSPDPLCNPYLAFTLLIRAGLVGVRQGQELCPPADLDIAKADKETQAKYATLPETLGEAVLRAKASEFIKASLPAEWLETTLQGKQREWEAYLAANSKQEFEFERYYEAT